MPEKFCDDMPIERLLLDPQNPRLPSDLTDRSQKALLQTLAASFNLVELARSIADKGFTPRHAEALLTVEEPPQSNTYVVVEGNRRLATLLLLTHPEKRQNAKLPKEWDDLAQQVRTRTEELAKVPILIYENREDVDGYLGFRHITGPTPWRPEPKARFIAHLLQDGPRKIDEVVKLIGSNHRTVRRYAEAYAIYQQALKADIDMSEAEKSFGVFYTALGWEGMRKYLCLSPSTKITEMPSDPVPEDQIEELSDLVYMLFGNKEREINPVIHRGTRELERLSEVLENERATETLLETRDLESAWHQAGGGKREVAVAIRQAHTFLTIVNGRSHEFKDDDTVRSEIKTLLQMARQISQNYGVNI